MQRLHARVYGLVQGVGFRQNTALQATQLGITGWVRNVSDGSVETIAEGEQAQLDSFLQFLQRGSVGSYVSRVETEWANAQNNFTEFSIRT